jgi:hypothetical protein
MHIVKKVFSPPPPDAGLPIRMLPAGRRRPQTTERYPLFPVGEKPGLCLFPSNHLCRIGLVTGIAAIELSKLLVRNLQGLWMRDDFVPLAPQRMQTGQQGKDSLAEELFP